MDALIRAARLAPFRLRLSETRVPAPLTSHPAAPSLREQMEAQVRAESDARCQEQYDAARERGRLDGLAEARQLAAQDRAAARDELRAQVDAAIAALGRAHTEALARLESCVGEVAFAAVCRLVGEKAGTFEFVSGLVAQACAQLRAETRATARLHPRDVELLRGADEGGELRVQAIDLTLVPDDTLPLGGCVLEAASGRFDGGLEQQLRRLHAVLTAE